MQTTTSGAPRLASDGSFIHENKLARNPIRIPKGGSGLQATGGPQLVGAAGFVTSGDASLGVAKKSTTGHVDKSAPSSSGAWGTMTWAAIAVAVIVVAAIAGIVGWQLSASDDTSGDLSSTLEPRGANESVLLYAQVTIEGVSPADLAPGSEVARDFCHGIEEAAALPPGTCQVTGAQPSSTEGGDSGPLDVTFALRLGPSYMPEAPEEDVAAAVEGALAEAADSGGLLEALQGAGEEGGVLATSLTAVGGVQAEAVIGSPSPSPSASPTPSVSPSPAPIAAPVPGGAPVRLPLLGGPGPEVLLQRSGRGQLLRMFRTSPDWAPPQQQDAGAEMPVPAGRSFDGRDWEPQPPLQMAFNCSPAVDPRGGLCSVTLPADDGGRRRLQGAEGGVFWVQAAPEAPAVSHEVRAARLLQTATFGTTRASIDAFPSAPASASADGEAADGFIDAATEWVRAQIEDAAPTSHRAYYRERANVQNQRPLMAGGVRLPCEPGSRWTEYALTDLDRGQRLTLGADWVLRVDGLPRAYMGVNWTADPMAGEQPWAICRVEHALEGEVRFGADCDGRLPNPRAGAFPPALAQLQEVQGRMAAQGATVVAVAAPAADAHVLTAPVPSACDAPPTGPVFLRTSASSSAPSAWLLHDPRLRLLNNEPSAPAAGVRPQTDQCPVVPRTILNAETCVPLKAACRPLAFAPRSIRLDDATLPKFYEADGRHVHHVTGLRLDDEDLPCDDPTSRWLRVGDGAACPSAATPGTDALDEGTHAWLSQLILEADDGADVVDVPSRNSESCTQAAKGVQILVSQNSTGNWTTQCWEHVHADHLSVYDFTAWTTLHLGNDEARDGNRPNPIAAFAMAGSPSLAFPSWHIMGRWNNERVHLVYVGRRNQEVDFAALPREVRTPAVAEALGAGASTGVDGSPGTGVALACGSPGEVSNDPALGSRYTMGIAGNGDIPDQKIDQYLPWARWSYSKSTAWLNTVLDAPDQLRQRVAWALSQILVVSEEGIQRTDEMEIFTNYYDIFTRNAFGNYRQVLREVSNSPAMAIMLTFYETRSLHFSLEVWPRKELYPDENYAREIMQLFTVGLWEMHMNGTQKLDAEGNPIPTYTNDDVLEMSRLWTGFDEQAPRSNIEAPGGDLTRNLIDPLLIQPRWRDTFPKLGLHGRHIGDTYPACWALPKQHFLRKGARYHFLGEDPMAAELHTQHNNVLNFPFFGPAPTSSALFAALCGEGGAGADCEGTLRSIVTLEDNLPCDGVECGFDTVRVVRIDRGGGLRPVYFEYERVPCVEFAFVEDGMGKPTSTGWRYNGFCLDKRLEAAGGGCCDNPTDWRSDVPCGGYGGERTSYSTAEARCKAIGKVLCDRSDPRWDCGNRNINSQWGTGSCKTQAQVHPDGRVSTIHDLADPLRAERVEARTKPGQDKYPFRVLWEGEYPKAMGGHYPHDACRRVEEPGTEAVTPSGGEETEALLLCNVTVAFEPAFDGPPASAREVVDTLHIGAPDPASFDDGTYVLCSSPACAALGQQGVQVHLPTNRTGSRANGFDNRAIFRAKVRGKWRWLANARSVVRIPAAAQSAGYSFRNPPQFLSHLQPTVRDARHETEAALDLYVEHENTAPFVADFFIKRFTTSNPSPGYVERVATAFAEGTYSPHGPGAQGQTFGTGEYGDLAATVAAVLLDREAISPVLEGDPTHGRTREPLIKLLHVLRALQFEKRDGMDLEMRELDSRFLQSPYMSPTVFNYFQSDFSPTGRVSDVALVSPEAQLLNSPTIITWLNGMLSLVEYGATNCERGLGQPPFAGIRCWEIRLRRRDPDPYWSGHLSWSPPVAPSSRGLEEDARAMVSELDLLLTGGRLSPASRGIMERTYVQMANGTASDWTDRDVRNAVIQLFTATPEFHAAGPHEPTGIPAAALGVEDQVEIDGDYKVIVYLFFGGGLDSYNLLVPRSQCRDEDLYAQYQEVRGDVALPPSELLDLAVPPGTQPCDRFGVHYRLPLVKELYDEGEAAFVANIGPMVEPVSRAQYDEGGVQLPPQLFAHNVQTKATQSVHAQSLDGKGVLGRLKDTLVRQGKTVSSYSISGNSFAVGGSEEGAPDIVDAWQGVVQFDENGRTPHLHEALEALVANGSTGMHADTWARQMKGAIQRSKELSRSIDTHGDLMQTFAATTGDSVSSLARQLEQVSRVVAARRYLGSKRDVFYVTIGGFDSHSNAFETLEEKFPEIDVALRSFKEEMVLQGVWGNTTVVSASEFARTLTSNGAGTDHAWGGNMFLLGGSLRGGRIHGQYPSDLRDGSELNIGRGRLIPTLSWEGLWAGISEWFGVLEDNVRYVLPNLQNFPQSQRISRTALYVNQDGDE